MADIDYRNFDFGDEMARWLVEDAFFITDTRELVEKACDKLLEVGVPVYRLAYFQLIDHPELFGHIYFWRQGQGADVEDIVIAGTSEEEVMGNPVRPVVESQQTQRYRLDENTKLDHPFLDNLRQEGASDHIIMPVPFSDGHVDALSVTSNQPGGFENKHLGRMFALQKLFARAVEIHSLRQKATDLLDIYVGHQAGARILDGQVRRGDGETIHTVILFCDMRDFSEISEILPRDDLMALLNDYFECFAGAIIEAGGEVVKFIGDAVLATFRYEDTDDLPAACTRAMQAVTIAFDRLAMINVGRELEGQTAIACGIALHVGDVMFGNIGAPGRLDYTVIGPAVNQASRLAGLCRDLSRAVLMSEDFAQAVPTATQLLGSYEVKGISNKLQVYTPGDRGGRPEENKINNGI